MTGKEMVERLKSHGFTLDRINGSHHMMVNCSLTVPVPVHAKRELNIKTQHRILKEAGLK